MGPDEGGVCHSATQIERERPEAPPLSGNSTDLGDGRLRRFEGIGMTFVRSDARLDLPPDHLSHFLQTPAIRTVPHDQRASGIFVKERIIG